MLSNLNTNMKVLIGISSITLLGILYSVIKYFFYNKKNMVEGLIQPVSPIQTQPDKGINDIVLKNVLKNIVSLNGKLDLYLEKQDNKDYIHQQFLYQSFIPNHFVKTTINLTNKNIAIQGTSWVFDLGSDDYSGFRVFNNVCDLNLLSAIIPKPDTGYTEWVDIRVHETPYLFAHMVENQMENHLIQRIYLDKENDTTNKLHTKWDLKFYDEKKNLSKQNINKLTIEFTNDDGKYHDIGDLHFNLELSITELTDVGYNYIKLLKEEEDISLDT